jgi:SsrA-binding protein
MGSKQRRPGEEVVATNRKARFDYEIDAEFEAGLVLTGTEVKSLRAGRVTLHEGYVIVRLGEAWLLNVHIPEYTHGNLQNHEPRRPRKLLLHDQEIERVRVRLEQQGYTGVPLKLYFKQGWAKLAFGLGRGRKHYDKRQHDREKTERRELRDVLG